MVIFMVLLDIMELVKTTTLKLSIAGIMEFDQGNIYIDNKSIKEEPLA